MLSHVRARGSAGSSGRRFDEDELLDAAREVFHAQGYNAAQIADIARRAGTTKPTLYARLGNKEEVYRRVIVREVDILRSWITAVCEQGVDMPLDELARAGMEPLFRFAAERPEGFDLLFRGDRAGERPINLRRIILRVVTEMLADLIVRRQRAVGPKLGPSAEPVAAACVGVAVQVCEHAIDNGSNLRDAHKLAAHFVASAFHSLDFETLTK